MTAMSQQQLPRALIRIGTRKSPLAMWQAEHIQGRLRDAWPGLQVELVGIETKGDKILDVALSRVGGKGLFVKELEQALLDGAVDLCVHSTKDVPAELPGGTAIVAFPERADPRDCFASPDGKGGVGGIDGLARRARVGTSSLRRQAQLLSRRPDLEIVSVRGNVATRLKKVTELSLSCVVLASAGLDRLAHSGVITHRFAAEEMLPAAGQGILAIQARTDDAAVLRLLEVLDHAPTRRVVLAERAFLKALGGGCQVPIAAYATEDDGRLCLHGLVARPDGRVVVSAVGRGAPSAPEELGRELAADVLARGGRTILVDVGVDVPGRPAPDAPGGALADWDVVVARDDAPEDGLSQGLLAAGARVWPLRLCRIEPPSDGASLERAVRGLTAYDIVVFTSRHAVQAFFERLLAAGLDLRALPASALVGSVGPGTSAALRARGAFVDVEGDGGGAALGRALLAARDVRGRRVLFPRAQEGREELIAALEAAGATVDVVPAYRFVPVSDARAATTEAVSSVSRQRRALVLTSPRRVEELKAAGVSWVDVVVAIGATTAEALRSHGFNVTTELPAPTATALVETLRGL